MRINPSSIRPLAGLALVRRDGREEKTDTGIYLPEYAGQIAPGRGVVVAIGAAGEEYGDAGKRAKPTCKVGDLVVFHPNSGISRGRVFEGTDDGYYVFLRMGAGGDILAVDES